MPYKNQARASQRLRERYKASPELRERMKAIGKRCNDKKRASGLCTRCGKPSDSGRVRCAKCRKIACDKAKKSNINLKLFVFNQYGGAQCVCCGETLFEFLTIDHIHGGGTEHRRQIIKEKGWKIDKPFGPSMYKWLKANNYPSGFRVLCMNCNWSRGMFGYCPHEKHELNIAQRAAILFNYFPKEVVLQ